MTKKHKISVCIATYNGEKYISEQLDSILSQLSENDEVVISDDASTDNTVNIIKSYRDSRLKVFRNINKPGVVGNFDNAISNANGDICFLADQDDIWKSNKVKRILDFFSDNPEYTCVFSNAELIDENNVKIVDHFFKSVPKTNFFRMVLKNEFLGCTMAFRNTIKLTPFSDDLPMHDWYIGLKHIQNGKVGFINENLISYRRHGANVTTGKRSDLLQVFKWRISILKAIYSK
ncbi:glycosyltransferase family 2 protein [Chryseobacterium foetidum]|uniref:glycosyltransferase family 2 protein n=1 Tax=Chryseobacterium foetidum TaxID=2951057 RepID=UPI0021C67632|nr:glycosyltransferase family 2 protein [Chryseobacterium foetidum]